MTSTNRTQRTPRASNTKGRACPVAVRRAISNGGEVDHTALLEWWTTACPEWLRDAGLSPYTAALLSVLPGATVRDLPGRLRFTMSPGA